MGDGTENSLWKYIIFIFIFCDGCYETHHCGFSDLCWWLQWRHHCGFSDLCWWLQWRPSLHFLFGNLNDVHSIVAKSRLFIAGHLCWFWFMIFWGAFHPGHFMPKWQQILHLPCWYSSMQHLGWCSSMQHLGCFEFFHSLQRDWMH